MDFNKYTQKSREAVSAAQNIAAGMHHQEVNSRHLFCSLLEQENGMIPRIITYAGLNFQDIIESTHELLKRLPSVHGYESSLSSGSDLIRVQCAFVDTPEVEVIADFIGSQRGYSTAHLLPEYIGEGASQEVGDVDLSKRDPFFEEAARIVVANQSGSTSLIQRRFSIGYNRAGRIIDQLEAAGVVGPFEGSKARQVLVSDDLELERIFKSLQQ